MGATASIPRYPPLQSPSVGVLGPLEIIQLGREMEESHMAHRKDVSKKPSVPVVKKSASLPKKSATAAKVPAKTVPPAKKVAPKKSPPRARKSVVVAQQVVEAPSTATPQASSAPEGKS